MKTLTAILLVIFAAHINVRGQYAETPGYPEESTESPGYPEESTASPGYSPSSTCGCQHKLGEGWTSQYTKNCGLTPPKNGDPTGCGCASSCNFLGSNCECNCKWKPGFLRGCDKKPSSECPINY